LSFIDKALERAKALHQKEAKPAADPSREDARPGITLPKMWLPERQELSDEILANTPVVPVDFEYLRQHRLLAGPSEPEVAEKYKLLRTHILHLTKEASNNVLMLTSPGPGEGKTLTAINLAISISQGIDQTVFLVDADLRSPAIHRYLGLPSGPGLVDHLTDGIPVSDLLIHPQGLGRLVLLRAGKSIDQASELINSPLMADLISELRHNYPDRYVIFDFPPLLSYADALAFAPLMDGIIVVVAAGQTSRDDIDHCLDMLNKFNVLGIVLNKAEFVPQTQYYQKNGEFPQPKKFKFPWRN
jgi:exopolysaccharide/PEP-CTERM locus tyrosine autokinase